MIQSGHLATANHKKVARGKLLMGRKKNGKGHFVQYPATVIIYCLCRNFLTLYLSLRCMVAPLSFELERVVNSSHQTGNGELSAGKLELTEYLFERSSSSTSVPMPYSSTQVNTVNFLFIEPFNSHE